MTLGELRDVQRRVEAGAAVSADESAALETYQSSDLVKKVGEAFRRTFPPRRLREMQHAMTVVESMPAHRRTRFDAMTTDQAMTDPEFKTFQRSMTFQPSVIAHGCGHRGAAVTRPAARRTRSTRSTSSSSDDPGDSPKPPSRRFDPEDFASEDDWAVYSSRAEGGDASDPADLRFVQTPRGWKRGPDYGLTVFRDGRLVAR